MWFQPLECWNLDFVSAAAVSCCSCRLQEGAFPERSFVQINTEWIRVAISLNGDGSVSPLLILGWFEFSYLFKKSVISGAGQPKKGHKDHEADFGSAHPGLLRGRQGNCAPGSALVWTWVPHGVTAGGLEAAPVTDLVRQMELDTLATHH